VIQNQSARGLTTTKDMLDNRYNICFEKSEKNLYITLSSKIIGVSKIIEIQENLRNVINCEKELKKIRYINRHNKLREIIKKDSHDPIIYQYSESRLHASIVNICYEKLNTKCFSKRAEKIKENCEDFIRAAKKLKRDISDSFDNKPIDFWIKRIYLENPIKKSIALNIFPHSCGFFKKIEEARKNFKYDTSIKAHPSPNYQYLVINLFRFIRNNKEYSVSVGKNFYEEIKKINSELEKNPIKIQIKPRLVFSDKYFSNKKYYL